MPCVTSSFRTGLLRKNLERFWPLMLLWLTFWIFLLPVALASTLHNTDASALSGALQQQIYSSAGAVNVVASALMGLASAMCVFAYLCSSRSVGMMHALPVTRRGLYRTNFLSGLAMLLLPLLAVLLLSLGILQAYNMLNGETAGWLLQWLLFAAGASAFFFSFGVLSMMFTGVLLAAPLLFAAFNFTAVAVTRAGYGLANRALFGADGFGTLWSDWLSPAYQMFSRMTIRSDWVQETADGSGYSTYTLQGTGTVLTYLVVGAVMVLAGWLLYRRRGSESAGDIVAVGWARPVFLCGFGACVGFAGGQLLYALAVQPFLPTYRFFLAGMMACMAVMGILGCAAAEMLLKKTFRIPGRIWLCAAAVAGLTACAALVVTLDPGGFETRIPAASEVVSAEYSLYGCDNNCSVAGTTEDPALIGRLLRAQRTVTESREEQKLLRNQWRQDDGLTRAIFSVSYTLRGGSVLHRSYTIFPAADNAALRSELTALYNLRAVTETRLLGSGGQGRNYTGGQLSVFYSEEWDSSGHTLTAADCRQIYRAVEQDIREGNFAGDPFRSGYGSNAVPSVEVDLWYTDNGDENSPGGSSFVLYEAEKAVHVWDALQTIAQRDGFRIYTQEEIAAGLARAAV